MIEHKSLFFNFNYTTADDIDRRVNEVAKDGWEPYATISRGEWSAYILLRRVRA